MIVIDYFEYPFPWNKATHKGDILFPEYTWEDIVHNFNITNIPETPNEINHFANIAFIKLSPFAQLLKNVHYN